MKKNNANDKNLNITINNPEEESSDIIISISTILRKLKKYLIIWIVVAVVLAVIAFAYAFITTHVKKAKLSALVNFSYSGIEKGLDPNGRKFDPTSIYNPSVIQDAVNALGMDSSIIEKVREGMNVYGLRPKDAMDRITTYKSILDSSSTGQLAIADALLDVSWNPTQFTVYFDYNNTDLSDSEAVELFDEVLKQYQSYFYETYGYNESLGTAVTAIKYTDYDYSEAVDVFSNSLRSLSKYVKQLSNEDSTRFRSSVTGYTFDDLYATINTIQSIDLDRISSYISINNLTKDKDAALAYYEYRIKALNRTKTELEEELSAYNDSINNYVKDQIIIFGNGTQDTDTQVTQASAQYDKMISQKNAVAVELAETKQSINYYKERQEALKSKATGTSAQAEQVEAQLADLNTKLEDLINSVALTSDDYYENVTFKNAYSVLVPPSNTSSDRVSRIISNAKMPLIALEALAVMVFFAVAFIEALVSDSRARKAEKAAAAAAAELAEENDGEDADDDEDDDTIDESEVKAEKKPASKKRSRK